MEKTLIDRVKAFSAFRVAVLGDLMLDRYAFGDATRISPEAPVPVVLVNRRDCVPGGAANVVRNVLALNAGSLTAGIIGKDEGGQELLRMLAREKSDTDGVLAESSCVTTVKTRILANNQQVVRIDEEQPWLITDEVRKKLLDALERKLSGGNCQALVMEDYAKGLFTPQFMTSAIKLAGKYGIFATLDPHPRNAFDVKGLKLMTPNRAEAFALAGLPFVSGGGNPLQDEALLRVGHILQERWAPELLLITLGADGMLLLPRDKEPAIHIPTRAQRVFDVSGAGDTVMATMTLALLAGASSREAAEIANYAAGVVVGYVGTRAIEAQELIEKLQSVGH